MLPLKGDPPWSIGDAAESITLWTYSVHGRPGNLITAMGAWLADLPQWFGTRLFISGDEEAYWRGWQITRLQGGLGRGYRDTRFGPPGEGASRP
jgi:hypothetical protein